jgi:hypothetical protein
VVNPATVPMVERVGGFMKKGKTGGKVFRPLRTRPREYLCDGDYNR